MKVERVPDVEPILLWERKLRNIKCDPVQVFGEDLANLAKKLEATCKHAEGVGLAAPQIGVFQRVAVIHYPCTGPMRVLVNPVIDELNSKGEDTQFEACLSLPGGGGIRAMVRRPYSIEFSYQDITGKRFEEKAEGYLARAISHEVDHLDGIFYIDRVSSTVRDMVLRKFQQWNRRSVVVS